MKGSGLYYFSQETISILNVADLSAESTGSMLYQSALVKNI